MLPPMKIVLKPHQEAYLRTLVSDGGFDTIEDALDTLIPAEPQDDAWMKPYVDDALADVRSGEVSPWSLDDLASELRARHPGLKLGADR